LRELHRSERGGALPSDARPSRRDTHGFALALGLVLASPAPACLDRFEEAREDGAQERLRDFKAGAKVELDRIGVVLQHLKPLAAQAGDAPSSLSNIEELVGRRNRLAERIDGLAVDGRSRWDEAKQDIQSQLADLALDVDAAAEAMAAPALRP
jgi:hypothetical protein